MKFIKMIRVKWKKDNAGHHRHGATNGVNDR